MRSGYVAALAVLTAVAAAPHAHADIASPNSKFITHTIRLEGAKTYADKYRFYTVAMSRIRRVPTPNNPTPRVDAVVTPLAANGELVANNVSPVYELRLGALPASMTPKDTELKELFAEPAKDVLLSDPIPRQRTISRTAPHSALLTRYRVVIKEVPAEKDKPATKTLSVALVGNEWSSLSPTERNTRLAYLLGVPFFALLGLVGRLRTRPDAE
jgi:hypothetical protein